MTFDPCDLCVIAFVGPVVTFIVGFAAGRLTRRPR